ncbi:MAG: hypothetical protein JW759_09170 [Candidatus Coatesbacteria bacterium]|nr:hypothetical protein [Candidatus Coatesbacteria bacterium]
MSSLKEFIQEINGKIGIALPAQWQTLAEIEIARRFLQGINCYFFQTRQGLGTTHFQGEELQYSSQFHKYWETSHHLILNAKIDRQQARMAARSLNQAIQRHGPTLLNVTHQTCGLPPQAIAQVRFFTANQDFREPPENQFGKYLEDPGRFDAGEILNEPADFLRFPGMTRLSQTDKRLDFAHNAARFLLEKGITAFQMADYCGGDALVIRDTLVIAPNIGYGLKKANMFIRDMVELGVWPPLERFDEVDVASDINTMELALRTRILHTDIPLVSSFLDIFCYQYSYLDEMSAMAWRAVWEEWQDLHVESAPRSPCLIDFLLYRVGREYCKDILTQYRCQDGHTFYHFGARLRKCRVYRGVAMPVARMLPCQAEIKDLPREEGVLLLPETNLLRTTEGVCLFENVCQPKTAVFRQLDPPKSISIKGQTSWTSAYADQERAGGGMMSWPKCKAS